ncbi:MAG: type VI secretion system tube protein Hcp [Gammaproteobacteria bacterium]|nr:type VI secretion system tube protein Hcp [Gammaproteobacteria bacterium]
MPAYLKIEGINGKVTAKGHEGWIACDSIQWGVGRSISSAVGTSKDREASKPSISEVAVSKLMDESTPLLFTEACVGKAKKVQIHLCTTGTEKIDTFMEYELEDCMISGYSMSSGGDSRPVESLSFSFTKMVMKFIPYDDQGKAQSPIPAGYDMALGTKV